MDETKERGYTGKRERVEEKRRKKTRKTFSVALSAASSSGTIPRPPSAAAALRSPRRPLQLRRLVEEASTERTGRAESGRGGARQRRGAMH